jgi:hypothetical protein
MNRGTYDCNSSSTKIENEGVTLTDDFLVKTADNSSSGGLVNDTKNIHSRNGDDFLVETVSQLGADAPAVNFSICPGD